MHLLELVDLHLGVDGRGVEPGVAEQGLDVADVRPGLQHVRGAGVAQQVAAARPPDVGRLDVAPDRAPEHGGADALAVAAQEQRPPEASSSSCGRTSSRYLRTQR